ncbi:ATP-binding protein [Labilibaculum sp. DW002]|uniref:histidine kinase n=1 Tax=Paralabilibaculum antarcticum TaxID=2912572 RepID=A0ABT5VU25_9BACT|nr:ATP-binding protein [Labilibaculum sp. DW002]MDE5418916.1 ATP-binding protein [Labilibaculum sp. DW002]
MKDLSMHIMDIIQNSVRAEASNVQLEIVESQKDDLFSIGIKDDGFGMSKEVLAKAIDPFFTSRTTRKVGLGISLLKQNAEQTGGSLNIWSKEGEGTQLEVIFSHSNIDRPVLGNIAETMMLLVGANPEMDFLYKHTTAEGEYVFDTKEVKEILEGVSLNDPNILVYLKEMINENINTII